MCTDRDVYGVSVVDVNCSEGRRCAGTSLGGMRFRCFVFSESLPEHMLWHMLPPPVLKGRMCKRPSFSTDELREKNILDGKEGERSRHTPMSLA